MAAAENNDLEPHPKHTSAGGFEISISAGGSWFRFRIGLERVNLSTSSPAFCPNSPAFRRAHLRNSLPCNNNNNGGQDLADKSKL